MACTISSTTGVSERAALSGAVGLVSRRRRARRRSRSQSGDAQPVITMAHARGIRVALMTYSASSSLDGYSTRGAGRRRPADLRPRSGRRRRDARTGSGDARLPYRRERQVGHLVRGHLRGRRAAGVAGDGRLDADLGVEPAGDRFARFEHRPQHGARGQVQRRAPRSPLRDRRGRDGHLGLVQLPELPQSPSALDVRVSGARRRHAPDLSAGLLRADPAGDPVAGDVAGDRRLHAGAAARLHPAARFLPCERRRPALALDLRARRSDVSAVGATRVRSDRARGALPPASSPGKPAPTASGPPSRRPATSSPGSSPAGPAAPIRATSSPSWSWAAMLRSGQTSRGRSRRRSRRATARRRSTRSRSLRRRRSPATSPARCDQQQAVTRSTWRRWCSTTPIARDADGRRLRRERGRRRAGARRRARVPGRRRSRTVLRAQVARRHCAGGLRADRRSGDWLAAARDRDRHRRRRLANVGRRHDYIRRSTNGSACSRSATIRFTGRSKFARGSPPTARRSTTSPRPSPPPRPRSPARFPIRTSGSPRRRTRGAHADRSFVDPADPTATTWTVRARFASPLPADATVSVLWKPFDSETDWTAVAASARRPTGLSSPRSPAAEPAPSTPSSSVRPTAPGDSPMRSPEHRTCRCHHRPPSGRRWWLRVGRVCGVTISPARRHRCRRWATGRTRGRRARIPSSSRRRS